MMIAVLLAGGNGTRFGSGRPKQFSSLDGKALLEYSLDVITSIKAIEKTILVINKRFESDYDRILKKYTHEIHKVEGGDTRQLSVYNALMFIEKEMKPLKDTDVLIHDSARPFSKTVFENVINGMVFENAVVPAIPLADTIYKCENNIVSDIPSRDQFVKVQTPQGFKFYKLLDCHKKAYGKKDVIYSDDGSLYLKYSNDSLKIVEGDQNNFKITKAVDLDIAQYILRNNQV